MRIVPLSKFEYRLFPINQDDNWIEITQEEYDAIETQIKCFSDDLTAVIDYVKTPEEIRVEEIRTRNYELYQQIDELKANLQRTDYQAIKYFEGVLTEGEFAAVREQRQQWRNQINELEAQIQEEQRW